MKRRLTLDELVAGLEGWNGRYDALDVFADDLQELHEPTAVEGLVDLGGQPRRFGLTRKGMRYELVIFTSDGVARLQTARGEFGPAGPPTGLAGDAGAAIDAALLKKGRGAELRLLLGLLIGSVAEAATPNARRRAFTMEFDPMLREWVAYSGGLIHWMRRELIPDAQCA